MLLFVVVATTYYVSLPYPCLLFTAKPLRVYAVRCPPHKNLSLQPQKIMSSSATLLAILLLILGGSLIAPSSSFQSSPASSNVGRFIHRYTSSSDGTEAVEAATTDNCSNDDQIIVSRRKLVIQSLTSFLSTNLLLLGVTNQPALAKVVSKPRTDTQNAFIPQERYALLEAIANQSSDEVIAQLIQNLIPFNPLKKSSSSSSEEEYKNALDGTWKLLWFNKSDFSPLLQLPYPLQPDSYQYFGKIAEQEVGEGRVAQGLIGGVVTLLAGGPRKELWLSSGAIPSKDDPSVLEIYPPFRFQLGEMPSGSSSSSSSSSTKQTIVESQSDAEFRAANARSTEAQLAPKNEYQQIYLENFGSGSLRVSVITKGDPVIVGDMFVHQKV